MRNLDTFSTIYCSCARICDRMKTIEDYCSKQKRTHFRHFLEFFQGFTKACEIQYLMWLWARWVPFSTRRTYTVILQQLKSSDNHNTID